jgi:hypothetical protein
MYIPFSIHSKWDSNKKLESINKGHKLLPRIKIPASRTVKVKIFKSVMSSWSSTSTADYFCNACNSENYELQFSCKYDPPNCDAYNTACKDCGNENNMKKCTCDDEGYETKAI